MGKPEPPSAQHLVGALGLPSQTESVYGYVSNKQQHLDAVISPKTKWEAVAQPERVLEEGSWFKHQKAKTPDRKWKATGSRRGATIPSEHSRGFQARFHELFDFITLAVSFPLSSTALSAEEPGPQSM